MVSPYESIQTDPLSTSRLICKKPLGKGQNAPIPSPFVCLMVEYPSGQRTMTVNHFGFAVHWFDSSLHHQFTEVPLAKRLRDFCLSNIAVCKSCGALFAPLANFP
jgi:hypothetical protein